MRNVDTTAYNLIRSTGWQVKHSAHAVSHYRSYRQRSLVELNDMKTV